MRPLARSLATVAAALFASASLLTAPPTAEAASAADSPGASAAASASEKTVGTRDFTYYWILQGNLQGGSHGCLDSKGAGEAYITADCMEGNVYQQWRIVEATHGVNIIHRKTGNCLMVGGGDMVYLNDSWYCTHASAQWQQRANGRFVSAYNGRCLDGVIGKVYTRPCNGPESNPNPWQVWGAVTHAP